MESLSKTDKKVRDDVHLDSDRDRVSTSVSPSVNKNPKERESEAQEISTKSTAGSHPRLDLSSPPHSKGVERTVDSLTPLASTRSHLSTPVSSTPQRVIETLMIESSEQLTGAYGL